MVIVRILAKGYSIGSLEINKVITAIKSKRAAHWQTGRAQVMTQGWQFPQNGTMPRYMNDSRYFSLGANPITLDAARQRNGLALPDAANFTHIPNEMDA